MGELDGEALEGVSFWDGIPHGLLKLFVAGTDSQAPLCLIGRKCWGELVGQLIVPVGGQAKVLQGGVDVT